jgi:hypothetical protein
MRESLARAGGGWASPLDGVARHIEQGAEASSTSSDVLKDADLSNRRVGMTRFRVPDEPKTVEQGAATAVMLAGSPQLQGVAGRYFEDCNEARFVHDSSGWIECVASWAIDPANAERLWNASLSMLAAAAA